MSGRRRLYKLSVVTRCAYFIIAMVAVNIVIGQGTTLGWLNPVVITLAVVFILGAVVFFRIESGNPYAFVDLRLFKRIQWDQHHLAMRTNGAC